MNRLLLFAVLSSALLCCGCGSSALTHEAYVWQRAWTTELSQAVQTAPTELSALRVLAVEWSGQARTRVLPAVDVAALVASGRPVVAVARIEGTQALDGLSLGDLAQVAARWSASGVRLRGLEVDHDCPTSKLEAYSRWLSSQRPVTGTLPLAITALPSWVQDRPRLRALATTVDAITLQLHAVRAPRLFEPARALEDVRAFAAATGRPLSVALPTYRVTLRDGTALAADPSAVQRFVLELKRASLPVVSVAWFRLGHGKDRDAWSAATWRRVATGTPFRAVVALDAVPAPDGSGAVDLVATNRGEVEADVPGLLRVEGRADFLDGLNGYAVTGRQLRSHHPPRLRPGESIVFGTARGTEIHLAVP